MKQKAFFLILLLFVTTGAYAQRSTDKLDRGLISTCTYNNSGNFISWKRFGEEYYDTKYNLYADGVLLAGNLDVCNYTHTAGKSSTAYQVAPVVRGTEGEKCSAVTRWSGADYYEYTGRYTGYIDIAGQPVYGRDGTDQTSNYTFNDVSLGDVNGDGVSEFIVKRVTSTVSTNCYHHTECYDISGNRLWWIDMGPNLPGAPDEQYDAVAYDWDQDGKAEVILRGADNMIIHEADGTVYYVGDSTANYNTTNYEYCDEGPEYLLYLEGATGKPYWKEIDYPLPRLEEGETDYATVWGKADGGHRATKHYFGAPFLDGLHPYIYLGRGCYTRHKMVTFSVDPDTHELTQYWRWNCYDSSSPYYGEGYHNYAIADVDMDGRDEIVFGSMVIDDNGQGLSTTGLGHGDAQHCTDLDPYRWGLEQFACNESSPCMNYRNATTSQLYYRVKGTSDDGRALAGNFTNDYPGSVGMTTASGGRISLVADKVNANIDSYDLNSRIYWDGDLCEEILNSPGTAKAPKIDKLGVGRLFLGSGNMNNSSKNNPGAVGDIFGDWREELVVRCGDALRIYTSNYPSDYGLYTLWHDHQYRNAMVWQCMGYNQPPHPSFFLGEMEGITQAPPPLTLTGRTVISNGGTISTSNNDQHVLVCETNDTKISVSQGASPWIATFNVPSWVQGTNSTSTTDPVINYTYYTCTVSGEPFTGSTRVVKQGEGTLILPAVTETYTGATDVWGGTLQFDGTMESSNVWLNRFTTLVSTGGSFKNIKMDYASKLIPGGEGTVSTVSCDTLKLGFGSRLVIDINSDLTADKVKAAVITIETKDWEYGPEYSSPVIEFNNLADEIVAGQYAIGSVSQVTGSLSDVRLEGLGFSHKQSLSLENGTLYLVVAGLRDADDIVWKGDESSIWDLASSENFVLESDTTESTIFVSGDNVIFNDDAETFSVTINDDISADSVIVDNTTSYVFSGNGALIDTTTLIKRGTGTLTINNDNSYTGGTRLSGGTVIVTGLSNSSLAKGALGAVNTSADKFIIENGAVLQTTQTVDQGSPMKMVGTEGGVISNSSTFNVSSAISGTKLTKKGDGTLQLNQNNPSLDTLEIVKGKVTAVGCTKPAGTLVFSGGSYTENGSSSMPVIVTEGTTSTWTLATNCSYSNKVTGSGTLTLYCNLQKGSSWYATRTPIACNFYNFTGTLVPQCYYSSEGLFTLNTSVGMPNAEMNIPSGVIVQNSGKTFAIGKVTGTGTLGGTCSFSQTGNTAINTWKVGGSDDFSFSGIVAASAKLEKVGEGKMTVSGKWTTTGAVTVSEGALAFLVTSNLGTGNITVAQGARLSGSVLSSNPITNSSITVNGELQSGPTAASTSGNIYMNQNNVTISSTGTYIVGVGGCVRSSTSPNSALLRDVGTLTINGTLQVFLDDDYTPQNGDSIRVFEAASFAGSPTYDLPDISNLNLEWNTDRISEGLIFVVGTTAIDNIINEDGPQDVYNLKGQIVRKNATSLRGLPAGAYIVKGRKITVK